jgi:hypothetical protein
VTSRAQAVTLRLFVLSTPGLQKCLTTMTSERTRAVILCALVSCSLVVTFTTGQPLTNPMSRMATMDALVHDGTFAIDRSKFWDTADKVKIGEHYYSSKPPILSVAGAGIYAFLHHVTGLSFRDGMQNAVWVMNLILAGVPHLILLVYAHRFLGVFAAPEVLLWTFAGFAFGQLGLAYATTINNHVPAGLAVFVAFYYAFMLRQRLSERRQHYAYAGVAAGLAPTLDLSTLFISAAIGLYLLSFDWKHTLRVFAPAAVAPLLVHFGLTKLITGSWEPIYLRPELYKYPGSYWNAPTGIDALDEPRLTYLYNILIGHHGYFSITPVLLVAVLAIVLALIRRGPHVAEAIVVGGSLLVLIVFYTLTTKNYGGVCLGFRWLLPITPLVLLFVADWLAKVRTRASLWVFASLLAISYFHAFSGLGNPWISSRWELWLLPDYLHATQAQK